MPKHNELVTPTEPNEYIAIVTKILGNGLFQVSHFREDRITTSLAHLRGNMKGKEKRNFLVHMHSYLLVATRPWNDEHSDILHIYSHNHLMSLQNSHAHALEPLRGIEA